MRRVASIPSVTAGLKCPEIRIRALTITPSMRPCARATSISPAGLCDMRAIIIAPLPTKTRANVPMNSAAKWRHASRIDVSPKVYGGAAARRERSLDHPAQYQRGVDSAEAERVREHMLDAFRPPRLRQKVKITGLVRNLKIDGRWEPLLLQRQRAYRCLDSARCAERVTVVPFCTAHRNAVRAVAQHLLDRHRLGRVVERRRASASVYVADLASTDIGVFQSEPHRSCRLRAVGARCGHVMGVVCYSVA